MRDLSKLITTLSLKIFGDIVKRRSKKYEFLRADLVRARIPVPFHAYLSLMYFASLLISALSFIFGLLISYILVSVIGLPEVIFPLALPPPLLPLKEHRDVLIMVILPLLLSAAAILVTRAIFLFYPKMKISERKGKIDNALPYAVTYLYALSYGGMNLIQIFKSLSEKTDVYGEVAREAGVVVREMEYFGKDFRSALAECMEMTPSPTFSEFLHNLLSIIESGGNVTVFLRERAEDYFQKALLKQKEFLSTLELMAEIYVTAFVAGPLFLIIINSIMNLMGSASPLLMQLVAYLILPVGTMMFAFLIQLISASSDEKFRPLKTEEESIPLEKLEKSEELLKKITSGRRKRGLKRFMKNPLQYFVERPSDVFYLSVPPAITLLAVAFLSFRMYSPNMLVKLLDEYVFISTFIAFLPFAIFHEIHVKRRKRIEEEIPEIFRRLANINETGMNMLQSLEVLANTHRGHLKGEIEKILRDIEIGGTISDAFARFANRVQIPWVARTITLIREAMKSSGNLVSVLNIAASDAHNTIVMKEERRSNMMTYVMIIYIAFFVFIGVIFILFKYFLPIMLELSPGSAGGFMGFASSSATIESVRITLFHASVIQGFFSGLVAGVMGGEGMSGGVKHALLMAAVAYLAFSFLI